MDRFLGNLRPRQSASLLHFARRADVAIRDRARSVPPRLGPAPDCQLNRGQEWMSLKEGAAMNSMLTSLAVVLMFCATPAASEEFPKTAEFKVPTLWEYTAPLISPEKRKKNPSVAQKDPSIVFHDGRWHVFMSVRLRDGRTAIEYCSFTRWANANKAPRTVLKVSDSKFYGAPQVFYFAPHRTWYLIYQMGVPGAKKMWVAYSTTTNIADPRSWTQAQPILDGGAQDPRQEGGLDYWIICDDQRCYLFFTSLNGKLWRMWTKLEEFPKGFDHCEIALQGPFFEA